MLEFEGLGLLALALAQGALDAVEVAGALQVGELARDGLQVLNQLLLEGEERGGVVVLSIDHRRQLILLADLGQV